MKIFFGKNIRKLRRKSGFSLRDMQKYTGVSFSYLSQIETGKKNSPSFDNVCTLAAFFKVDPIDLYYSKF